MNSKERTLLAWKRQEPDRVPTWVTVVAEMAHRLAQVTGIPADPLDAYLTNRISHAALLTTLGNDVVGIGSTAPSGRPTRERPDGFLEDEWGFVYRRVPHPFRSIREPDFALFHRPVCPASGYVGSRCGCRGGRAGVGLCRPLGFGQESLDSAVAGARHGRAR